MWQQSVPLHGSTAHAAPCSWRPQPVAVLAPSQGPVGTRTLRHTCSPACSPAPHARLQVAALLNTKKAKLRELQDQLKEAQVGAQAAAAEGAGFGEEDRS